MKAKYNSIAELSKAIEDLQELDLNTTTYKEIKKRLDKSDFVIQHAFIPRGRFLYRARINPFDDRFTNVSDLSYRRDVKNITNFGRVNPPNKSMFYASDSPAGAAYECSHIRRETDPTMGEEVITIGAWRTKKKINVIVFPYDDIAITNNKGIRDIHLSTEKLLEQFDVSEQAKTFFKICSKEFSKIISDNCNEYKISCAIYETIISKNPQLLPVWKKIIEGICYPSIRVNHYYTNVALEPFCVDEKLELYAVESHKVKKESNFVTVTQLDYCKVNKVSPTFELKQNKKPFISYFPLDIGGTGFGIDKAGFILMPELTKRQINRIARIIASMA